MKLRAISYLRLKLFADLEVARSRSRTFKSQQRRTFKVTQPQKAVFLEQFSPRKIQYPVIFKFSMAELAKAQRLEPYSKPPPSCDFQLHFDFEVLLCVRSGSFHRVVLSWTHVRMDYPQTTMSFTDLCERDGAVEKCDLFG